MNRANRLGSPIIKIHHNIIKENYKYPELIILEKFPGGCQNDMPVTTDFLHVSCTIV
jgi:hypothetical protein